MLPHSGQRVASVSRAPTPSTPHPFVLVRRRPGLSLAVFCPPALRFRLRTAVRRDISFCSAGLQPGIFRFCGTAIPGCAPLLRAVGLIARVSKRQAGKPLYRRDTPVPALSGSCPPRTLRIVCYHDIMEDVAQLIVRKLENEVKDKLSRRAKRHGRSVEEEVREILRDATKREGKTSRLLGTEIARLFRRAGLKPGEEIRQLPQIEIQPADFEE